MTIPGNPDYFSLNVASAIQVFAYQNYVYNTTTQFEQSINSLNDLFQYLKQKSPIVSGFFLWVLFISQMA
jgi:tRNA C32,U32 (ribose-2'-O)-methylase TrmJ